MSKRTRFLLGIGVIAALVIGWQVAAFAVHDTGAFELDGNATNGAAPGDDWDNVCHQVNPAACPTATNTNGATAVDWVAEPNPSASIFTGGGSKDPNDLDQWAWKDAGGLPDKDNLLHSFAARYSLPSTGQNTGTCPNGSTDQTKKCEVLYFGSDRFDNSGDAQQGFWFFQNEVTLGNTAKGGGFNFNGVHKTGDLLIISDFSNGGNVSTISVYSWDPTVSGNLKLLASSSAANCASATTGDKFCGLVNADTITMPWSFTDKSGTPDNQALNGEFYEGGVNLSALGLGDRCFSSVASETRSSTSTTATLKDFVLGKFGNCSTGMNTVPVQDTNNAAIPAGGVSPGTAVKDGATITVTGTTTWTGNLKFFLCSPAQLDAQGLCSTGGSAVGDPNGITVTNATGQPIYSALVNTAASPLAPGNYCFRGEFTSGTTGVPNQKDFDSSECFTVRQPTTVSTAQRWIPQDTATVTGGSGTVTFQLYSSDNCAAGTELGQPITDNSAPYETNNTTPSITDTSVSWRATFDPDDANADNSSSACEVANVTFTETQ